MTAPTVVCSGIQLNDLNVVRGSPNKNRQAKNPKTQTKTNKNNTKTLKESEINAGETVKRTNYSPSQSLSGVLHNEIVLPIPLH